VPAVDSSLIFSRAPLAMIFPSQLGTELEASC